MNHGLSALRAVVILVLFGAMAAPAAAQSGSLRVGIIDADAIIKELPAAQEADKALTNFARSIQDSLAAMEKSLQDRLTSYQQKEQMMTADAKAKEENDLRAMQQQMLQFRQVKSQELEQRRANVLVPLRERIDAAVKAVAQEEKLNLVLDKSTTVVYYNDKNLEITWKVLDHLNRGEAKDGQ